MNIGLLGLGTVGSGVIEILEKRRSQLTTLAGEDINVKKVLVKNKDKKRNVNIPVEAFVSDFKEILEDEEISLIIEVTGDVEASYRYIKEGLNAGKHIVTANKAVVSEYFEELSALASEKNLAFLYEASVGGGIPVLKPLKEQLELNEISQVQGILNGTCNYILTRMVKEGKNYDEVLKIAQDLGYAEADPSADVDGVDTLRKLRILGTLSLQGTILEEDILLDGISSINSIDMENIRKMNSTVKLVAEANAFEDGFTAIVQPVIVKNTDYFANVDMAYNSVAFEGDNVGKLKFYGSGAGKLPTANAVISDCLDIAMKSYNVANPLGNKKLRNYNNKITGKFYLRVSDLNEDAQRSLRKIAKEVLNIGSVMALITDEIPLATIKELISSLGIRKEKYFLGRIME